MARKFIITVTASIFALGLVACNTVSGAGEDLQSISEDVDEEI